MCSRQLIKQQARLIIWFSTLHSHCILVQVDGRRPAAPLPRRGVRVPLRREDHVVVLTELHAEAAPRAVVVPRGDGPADALLRPYAPELLEGRRADDGGLVHPGALVDGVGAPVGGEVALLGPGLVGRELAVGVDDVVLDQGVPGPAVQGEVARAVGLVRSLIVDGPAEGKST